MKKIIALLLVFVMVRALAACAAAEEPAVTVPEKEEPPFAVIEAKNCFYDAGYIEFVAGAEKTAKYSFTGEDSEMVEWHVYVLDRCRRFPWRSLPSYRWRLRLLRCRYQRGRILRVRGD